MSWSKQSVPPHRLSTGRERERGREGGERERERREREVRRGRDMGDKGHLDLLVWRLEHLMREEERMK